MTADERLAELERVGKNFTTDKGLYESGLIGWKEMGREILWATGELRKMVEAMRIIPFVRDLPMSVQEALDSIDDYERSAESTNTTEKTKC